MNLLELYALQSGQTIGKVKMMEKFYPLNLEKYIIFHPFSKPSKSFDSWQDVIEILLPIVKEAGYTIVQVGVQSEPLVPGCLDLRGRTSVNQVSYLVSRAAAGLFCDSFCAHLAGISDIPRVILISNNYSECVSPYFGSPEKQIILEPDRTKRKPSFLLDEGVNKQINEIKPEIIAESVTKLLGLPFYFPYQTLYVGENYRNKILEVVPNGVTNIQGLGTDSLVVRLDFEFNEQVLAHQMQHCPVTIVTNKPINTELLKAYRERIKQIFYIVEENNDPKFAAAVQKLNIPLSMFSVLPPEILNNYKLDYLDIAPIIPKRVKKKEEISEICNVPPEKLFYKSSKHTLSKGSVYSSRAALENNVSVPTINQITPIIDNETFWGENEFFTIYKEKNS